MFGDEPYGNYNRILLSGVLAGTQRAGGHLHQPARLVRRQRRHAARRRRARRGSTARRRSSTAHDGDRRAVRHAGDRHRQQCRSCRRSRTWRRPTRRTAPAPARTASSSSARSTTASACSTTRRRRRDGRGDRRRAARPRGGARPARAAASRSTSSHLMAHLMEVQLDRDAGRHAADDARAMGVKVHLEQATTGRPRRRRASPACSSRTARRSTATWWSSPPASGRTSSSRNRRRPRRSSAASSSTTSMRDRATRRSTRRRVRRAPRHGLRPGRAALGAGAGARRRLTGRTRRHGLQGSRISTKLKVMGVDLAVDGREGAASDDDEVVSYSEPARGIYKKLIVRDGQARRRDPARRRRRRRRRCCRPSIAARALPDDRAELLFPSRDGRERRRGSPTCRTTRRSATATASPRARSSARVRAGCTHAQGASATRRAPAPAAARASPGAGDRSRPSAGDDLQEDPSAHYYVPGVPLPKPRARSRAITRARTCAACRRCSTRSPAARRIRRSKAAWRRC